MSMLAEPRRKQKWSVDPRNSAWSNDESKFGQKMLKRMGWSKGKGLGRHEQGATEHIKVKVKNNTLGLGTSVCNDDNWITHQDDFNQLLADLNSCHGQNRTDSPTQKQSQVFSLEEKSKMFKSSLHEIHQRGKDLSCRSKTDLACICGKRAKQQTTDQEGSSGPDSQKQRKDDNSTENNPDPQLNTVTSTLTMQEYFAKRMAQLKRAQTGSCSAASPPVSTEDSTNTSDIEQSKKKKSEQENDGGDAEEKAYDVALLSSVAEVIEEQSHKKRRKREESNAPTVIQNATEEESSIPERKTSLDTYTDTAAKQQMVKLDNMNPENSDKRKSDSRLSE